MPTNTVKLTGGKAVLALLVIVGVAAFRMVTANAALDTQGRAEIQRWVQSEVIRPILADTTRSTAAQDSALLQASSVKVRSLAVRGRLSHAVLRVELAPSPALPPGAPLVRYYYVQYSSLTGWHPYGSATALNWYLALF